MKICIQEMGFESEDKFVKRNWIHKHNRYHIGEPMYVLNTMLKELWRTL